MDYLGTKQTKKNSLGINAPPPPSQRESEVRETGLREFTCVYRYAERASKQPGSKQASME